MSATPSQDDRPPINLARLGDTFGDDPEFLTEMYGIYVGDAGSRLGELDRALAGDDSEKVEDIAHALKGSSGNVGAERMSALAAELERVDFESDPERAQNLATQLHTEFAGVMTFVERFVRTPL